MQRAVVQHDQTGMPQGNLEDLPAASGIIGQVVNAQCGGIEHSGCQVCNGLQVQAPERIGAHGLAWLRIGAQDPQAHGIGQMRHDLAGKMRDLPLPGNLPGGLCGRWR
jgi:hypothetical protein